MQEIGQQFEEELQELLGRYNDKMSTPVIMWITQSVFHSTLSFAKLPERFPFATEKDYLAKFITERSDKDYAFVSVDELEGSAGRDAVAGIDPVLSPKTNAGDWIVSDKEPL